MLARKQTISARLVNKTVLHGPQFLMVRPSRNNMHEFVAEENTCFFDICLPNYTADSLRRITYFQRISEATKDIDPKAFADSTLDLGHKVEGLTHIAFDSTPPNLPVDFEIADLPYRGEMKV